MKSFETSLVIRGLAEQTVKDTVSRVKRILTKYPSKGMDRYNDIILDYKARGCSNNTINIYLKALKHWCRHTKCCDPDDFKLLPRNTSKVSIMSEEELKEFCAVKMPANCKEHVWDKYQTLFATLIYTGCRPGEAMSLKVDDVDFGSNHISIVATKTRSFRNIPIAPPLKKY